MSLYKAMSEEEAMKERYSLLEDGDYDAVVQSATRAISKNGGNVMSDMWVTVFDRAGNPIQIRDFLVFSPKMLWKIKHFCDSSGQTELYEKEKFEPEMALEQHVRVRIRTQKGGEIPFDKLKGKPPGSVYPDKNVIDDYIPGKSATIGKPENGFKDDEVPF